MYETFIDNGAVIRQGADFSRSYQWIALGEPKDLTGATIECKFKKDYADTVAVLTLTTADASIVLIPSVIGGFTLVATAEQTADIIGDQFATLVFDIKITTAEAEVVRLVEGVAQFSPEATR